MFPSSDVGPRELKMKQIKNWAGSETDKSSADYHPPKKIKFPLGVSLIAACYANDEEEFKQLLGMGIDIDTRNPDGMTCVHQCCINGDYEFLEFLIKEGADINVQDNEGWTPLHAAASVGREEMVRLLLDNGADVSLLSCEMELPVDVSQSDSVTDLLNEVMRARGIDPVVARQTEEQLLLRDVKQMLETGKYEPVIDPRTGATPLHVAACKDYLAVLEMILKIPGVDLNCQDNDGWTALHAAAHWNREASIRLLAEAGASFDLYTLANQSVFDVADRQVVVLLRQLRERQRSEKKVAPLPAAPTTATAVDQLPKSAEAIKRGHPFDSESSEDSKDSEESSEDDEKESITANKKPALDSVITTAFAAAGDHSTNAGSTMNDALAALMNDHRPVVVNEKMAGVEEESPSSSQSPISKKTAANAAAELPRTKFATPPLSSVPSLGSQTYTDTENGSAPVISKSKEKVIENSVKPRKTPSPTPPSIDHSLKELTEGNESHDAVVELNGMVKNQEPFDVSEHKVSTTTEVIAAKSVPPMVSRRPEDRLHDSHVRLRSPPARPTPTPQSPSPPPTPHKSTEITTSGTTITSVSADESESTAKAARIVTIRKRTSIDNSVSSEGDSTTASPTPITLTAVTVPTTVTTTTTVSSSTSPSSAALASAASAALLNRPESTRSSSPLSGDDLHENRRVSFVMAPAKSGETETQRSVKARYVRSTRRSTQGVSAEELEQAKRLIDHNNNSATMSSGAQPTSSENSQPQEQQQKSSDSSTDTSLRPRLDRPTVHITRTAAIRSPAAQSPVESDSVVRRRPTGDEAFSSGYGTDDILRNHRGNRQSEAEERVKATAQTTPSSDNTYFPYRGISSRLPSTNEDVSGSRSSSVSDSPFKGSRDRSFRDRLVEATEYLEREQLLNRRRAAQRQSASSPTSPSLTSPATPGNSTGVTSTTDLGVKPIVPRIDPNPSEPDSQPSSRFLHFNDSSSSGSGSASTAPVSNSTDSTTSTGNGSSYTRSGNSSYGVNRSGNTSGTTFTSPQPQYGNAVATTDSRYGGDSRSTSRTDRSHPYQDTVDYRRLYEQEKINRERLQKQLDDTLRELSRVRIQLASLTQAESNNTSMGNSTVHNTTETTAQFPMSMRIRRFRINGDTLKRIKPTTRGEYEDEGRERSFNSCDQ